MEFLTPKPSHKYLSQHLERLDIVVEALHDLGINCDVIGDNEQPNHEIEGRVYSPPVFMLECVTSATDDETRAHVFAHAILEYVRKMVKTQQQHKTHLIFVTLQNWPALFANSKNAKGPFLLHGKVSILVIKGQDHDLAVLSPDLATA
jgi:hypothetical protein